MKKVLVFSGHFWKWPFKAGIHYLTEFFIREKYSVQFVTVGNSCLTPVMSILGSGSRVRLKESMRFLLTGGSKAEEKIIASSLFSLYHPANLYPSPLAKYSSYLQYEIFTKNFIKFSYPRLPGLLKKTDFEDFDILMLECGMAIPVWNYIKNRKFTIYRISDDINNLGYLNYFMELEKEIIRKADIVLAVSAHLYDKAKKIRGNTHGLWRLPNGTDLKIFTSSSAPLPEEYKYIKRPIAVYIGNTNKVDFNILLESVRSLPWLSFVIIGPQPKIKEKYPNLYFLGLKNKSLLPSYTKRADIGIIPFHCRFTDMERPIKFYDYLASGLPIVSTNFGNAKSMKPYARVADNTEEFLKAIRESLDWSEEDRMRHIQAAQQFSWEAIYKQFRQILVKTHVTLPQ